MIYESRAFPLLLIFIIVFVPVTKVEGGARRKKCLSLLSHHACGSQAIQIHLDIVKDLDKYPTTLSRSQRAVE